MAKLVMDQRLTIPEFRAMVDERPDGEHRELVEGIAKKSPRWTMWHQAIVGNIAFCLAVEKGKLHASWMPLLGIFTQVPACTHSLPWPDVIVKEKPLTGAKTTKEAIVIVEVLSPINRKSDQAWRRRMYASVPNCQHYVTASAKIAVVERFDRADGWAGQGMQGLDAVLEMPAINTIMPLRDIYRWMSIE